MRDWITKDFGWKLFSLFLAVAIWLTVHKIYEEPGAASGLVVGNTVTFGNLPVLIVSTAKDVRDFRVAPLTVKVTVSGSAEDMAKLQANQVRAVVDLTDIESAAGFASAGGRVRPAGSDPRECGSAQSDGFSATER